MPKDAYICELPTATRVFQKHLFYINGWLSKVRSVHWYVLKGFILVVRCVSTVAGRRSVQYLVVLFIETYRKERPVPMKIVCFEFMAAQSVKKNNEQRFSCSCTTKKRKG